MNLTALLWLATMAVFTQSQLDIAIRSIVSKAEATSRELRKCALTISTYRYEDTSTDNLERLAGAKKLLKRARVYRDSDRIVVEYLGGSPGAELAPGHALNDVSSVYASNGKLYYEYVPLPSTGNPIANLNRYAFNDPRPRNQIRELIDGLDPNILFGQKLETFLSDPNLEFSQTSENGYTLRARGSREGVSYLNLFVFDSLTSPELVSVGMDSRSNGSQTKMERRIAYQNSEGVRIPKTITTLFDDGIAKNLESSEIAILDHQPINKIDDDYFRRYQRLYLVSNFGQPVDKEIDATPKNLQATYEDRMAIRVRSTNSLPIGFAIFLVILTSSAAIVFLRKRWK